MFNNRFGSQNNAKDEDKNSEIYLIWLLFGIFMPSLKFWTPHGLYCRCGYWNWEQQSC